jgi:hypothetical protein
MRDAWITVGLLVLGLLTLPACGDLDPTGLKDGGPDPTAP